jgi:hypothetical protein
MAGNSQKATLASPDMSRPNILKRKDEGSSIVAYDTNSHLVFVQHTAVITHTHIFTWWAPQFKDLNKWFVCGCIATLIVDVRLNKYLTMN